MKKVISVFLAALMLFAVLQVTSFAADPITCACADKTEWNRNDKDSMIFTSTAALTDLKAVSIDGQILSADTYAASESETGIIVVFAADYMATLANGKHTFRVQTEANSAACEFSVAGETSHTTPIISEEGRVVPFNLVMMIFSLIATTIASIFGKIAN